ncbi:MAG: LTA synthase family protein [Pseudomonadota bacterium]
MNSRLILRWLVLWVGVGAAMRAFFLSQYPADPALIGGTAFFAGALNDVLAFLLALGLAALCNLVHPRLARPGFVLALAVAWLVCVAEIFFWLEFEGRLDRLVFHYLAYPKEVLVFLEDQFYLSLFAVPFIVLVWLTYRGLGHPDRDSPRSRAAALVLAAVGVLLWGSPWQPAALADSRVALAFVNNGYLSVLEDARYPVDDIVWLQQQTTSATAAPLVPPGPLRQQLARKRHVVLIIQESFAGPVWREAELRQRYLPNFVALEKRSLSFTNLYATGSRTTRGMEAILNGFPPLPGISTTERAQYERLPALPRVLQQAGFRTAFLYGGWPDFSNFSNYWRAAGFQQIWSREDFNEDFETSWGVSDQALFTRLLAEMSALTHQHDRVFLSTLTVSHHRPYEFPPGVVAWPADARESAYAMAYADQSLGDFMRQASEQDWYNDTIFIVVADHGPYPRGDAIIPLDSFRIPLLIYGNGISPRVFAAPGSSISLPLTVLQMLDLPKTESFSGASLLCDCATPVPVEYGYHLGLLEDNQLQVLDRHGGWRQWQYTPESGALLPLSAQTGVSEQQQRLLAMFAPAYQWYYSKRPD